jgi:hypothetical protein
MGHAAVRHTTSTADAAYAAVVLLCDARHAGRQDAIAHLGLHHE